MLLYFVPREAAVKQQDHFTEYCAPAAGYQDSLSRTRTAWEKVPDVMDFLEAVCQRGYLLFPLCLWEKGTCTGTYSSTCAPWVSRKKVHGCAALPFLK